MGRPTVISDESITVAELALSRRMKKGVIKEILRKRFDVSTRTTERILARARANIVEASGKPRESHREDAYAFYSSVISDPSAAVRTKLIAQERIDKLLGLESANKLELSGPDGRPIRLEAEKNFDPKRLTKEERRQLLWMMDKASEDDGA